MNNLRRALVTFSFVLSCSAFGIANAAATAGPSRTANISANTAVSRINAIRRSDGLAPGTATNAYGPQLAAALTAGQDPDFGPIASGVVGGYSLWGAFPQASGATAPSPAAIVDAWVGHDGWSGQAGGTWNLDCTGKGAPNCDGHRRAILSSPPVPGARLFIDAATRMTRSGGVQRLSLVTLLIWQMPGGSPKRP